MKNSFLFLLLFLIVSCYSSKKLEKINSIIENKADDSIFQFKYQALKEYALCNCVYNVPENIELKKVDVSPSIYAEAVNFWGIDTIQVLAKSYAESIEISKYFDHKGKKPVFTSCSTWVNSGKIDSLIRKYAMASANEEIRSKKVE